MKFELKQLKTSRIYWILQDRISNLWWILAAGIIGFWSFFFFIEYSSSDSYSNFSFSEFEQLALEPNLLDQDELFFDPYEEEQKKKVPKPIKLKIRSKKESKSSSIDFALRQLRKQYPKRKYIYWKTVNSKVTAYTNDFRSCGRFADGKTSKLDNAFIFDGVAAAPKVIPYRTGVYIPNIGIKEVDDTGGAMRKAARRGYFHIDVRMRTNRLARKWGVKWKKVHLFKRV